MLDFAAQTNRPFRVFSLDTGRHPPRNLRIFGRVEEHYGLNIEYTPDSTAVQNRATKGHVSFLKDGHKECCGVRKIEPLVRQLLHSSVDNGPKTGPERHENCPALVQEDPVFRSRWSTHEVQSLSEMTQRKSGAYIQKNNVPQQTHERGMTLGCAL